MLCTRIATYVTPGGSYRTPTHGKRSDPAWSREELEESHQLLQQIVSLATIHAAWKSRNSVLDYEIRLGAVGHGLIGLSEKPACMTESY